MKRIRYFIREHWMWIIVLVVFIVLLAVYSSVLTGMASPSAQEWFKQPVGAMTKGELVALVFLAVSLLNWRPK
jgi:cell shape-determining protein MreD